MALEKELETYRRELPRLVAESQGKFALIRENDVVGVFDSYEDAVRSGYEKFQLRPFMVKQIAAMEQAHFFTRDLIICGSNAPGNTCLIFNGPADHYTLCF